MTRGAIRGRASRPAGPFGPLKVEAFCFSYGEKRKPIKAFKVEVALE